MSGPRFRTTLGVGRGGGIGGRIAGSIFSLVFMAIGLAVTVLFAMALLKGVVAWTWDASECRVESAAVDDLLFSLPHEQAAVETTPYRLAVAYQWERDGRVFRGDHVGSPSQYSTRSAAEKALAKFPAGGTVRCYVDPDDPTQASLRRGRLWMLLLLGFPLIFVAFGVFGLVASWRGGRSDGAAAGSPAVPRSLRSRAGGRGCAVAAFGLFALFGAGFLLPFAIPAKRLVASGGWERVPADILWSGVGVHSGDDNDTYSVDVLYEYEHGGRHHRSNRYGLSGGSSSGRAGKEEAVARLPAGARVDAWVDPREPSSAVLDRSLGWFMWFSLLPLVFLAIGVGGMAFTLRAGKGGAVTPLAWLPKEGRDAAAPPAPALDGGTAWSDGMARVGLAQLPEGPITIAMSKSRWGGFLGLLFFTLVWNGIVGTAIWAIAREGKLGHDGCATAFVAVFAFFGALMLISLPGKFLSLFNPRPTLTLSAPPAPGVPVAVAWRFEGAASRLARVTILFEGREEATYRRGTDTVTDRREFARLVLLDTRDAAQIAGGETLLALPADTMHSFQSSHNKVVWSLKLHGEIARWPDIDDDAVVTVYPTSLLPGAPRTPSRGGP
jgi:hypothetical protein